LYKSCGDPYLDELVQMDGTEDARREARAETCTLLASFRGDATSRLMQVGFVASESAFDHCRTTNKRTNFN